ncbi:MAG TPA: cell wall-binding repeat-containing protein [Solirubrobacteraceae bacterium]|nr:cell wall-binding repeat-containing protein [Solirubrobacteraceae bacterium]
MRAPSPRQFAALALCGGVIAILTGCGKGGGPGAAGTGSSSPSPPPQARGVAGIATKNTTRLGGADPADDAAAVAQAVYPGLTPATRPQAVVLVNEHDWASALASSSLAAAPLGAPVLLSDGDSLPESSNRALGALHPLGATALGGAQVVSIGARGAVPGGYRVKALGGTGAAATGTPGTTSAPDTTSEPSPTSPRRKAKPAGGLATSTFPGEVEAEARAAVDVLHALEAARGHAPREAIVVPVDAPKPLQMPAASLAAESGAPILFVTSSGVPPPTRDALQTLKHATIYVIAPKALHASAYAALTRLGTVVHITGEAGPGEGPAHTSNDPVENAISVSRFSQGTFGWGIHEAGHGLVFANVDRPLDAPAAAPLSAHGDYGPLLLLQSSAAVPSALTHYLSNIEPGYTTAVPPVREVYNHGWLIGDERAISALAQAELDAVLEIAPRQPSAAEQSVAEAE